MRRGSVVGPFILILVGVAFLISNLHPELSVIRILGQFWPFLLMLWGVLRLIEILIWAARRKPLPLSGISGGEWLLVILISVFGSAWFFVSHRNTWPPISIRMRGLEMLGDAYDYPVPERTVSAAGKSVRIVIDNPRGNARVNGTDGSELRMSGRKTVRAMNKEEADRAERGVQFEMVREGDTVFIRPSGSRTGPRDQFVTADLEISVPRGVRVEAHGRRGDFDITDVQGDVDIDSDNAGVRLETIGGNIRVDVRASDIVRAIGVKGGAEIKGAGHDLELDNISGQVTVAGNFSGDLQFRAIPNSVRFEGGMASRSTEWRVEACPGEVRMSRGNLSLDNVVGPVLINARSKDIQVSRFTQGLDLRVERGDVEIRSGGNPVPRMTVATNSGDVELTLPPAAKFALKATVDHGEVQNDYGDVLQVREQGRGATITGNAGTGAEVNVYAGRGSIRVRKGSKADVAAPLPPKPPRPVPQAAPHSLEIQHN